MPRFFETMARLGGSSEINIPEMLRTHPVSTTRIAETKERAVQLEVKPDPPSPSYALTRERLRVLSTPAGEDPRAYYAATITNLPDATPAQVYGQGLALMMAGQPAKAVPIFERLRSADPTLLQYHTALGQAQLQAGDGKASIQTLKRALELFPRNVAVTIRYAETLMQKGDSKQAHEILLDLFNTVPPTPEQAKLTAQAANAAGDVADSYYYMSEYHIMSGDLLLAAARPGRAEDHRSAASALRSPSRRNSASIAQTGAAPGHRSQQRRRPATRKLIQSPHPPGVLWYSLWTLAPRRLISPTRHVHMILFV
jgi:predicted Zn-dependent protease